MTVKRPKFASAVTMMEVLLAMVILAIAAIGAMNYQYYAVGHVQIARAQMEATRIAQMLLEDWKSTGGGPAYNPIGLGLGITGTLPPVPITPGGSGVIYYITQDNITMKIILSSANVVEGTTTLPLRQITVTVQWRQDFGPGTIQYTTYVRIDT